MHDMCEQVTTISLGRELLLERARKELKARDLREAIFGKNHFPQPEWSILLELYIAEAENRKVLKMHAIRATNAPAGTASRYLARMIDEGIIEASKITLDRRSAMLALTSKSRRLLDEYFTHSRND